METQAGPTAGLNASLFVEAGDHAHTSLPPHPLQQAQPVAEEQRTLVAGDQGRQAATAGAAAAPQPPADPQQQQLAQRAAVGAAALEDILARVSALDTEGWFRAPVREVDAPNYYKIIRRPMCFQVMQSKVAARQYASWSEVVRDFELICSNAMKYNQKRSRIHKLALVMLRAGKKLLVEVEPEGRRAVAEMQLAPAPREGDEEGARVAEQLLESRVAPTSMLRSGMGMASTGLTPPSTRMARSISTLDTASTGEGHMGAVALDPPEAGGAQGPGEEGYSSYSETDLEGEGEPPSFFWPLGQGGGVAEALPHAGDAVLAQADQGPSAEAVAEPGAAASAAAAGAEDVRAGAQPKAWRQNTRSVEWRLRWLELRLIELRRQRRRYVELQQAQQRQEAVAGGREALHQPLPRRLLLEWQLPGLLEHPFFREHSVVGMRSGLAQAQAGLAESEQQQVQVQAQQPGPVAAMPSSPIAPLSSGGLPYTASTPQLLIPPTPPLASQPAASAAGGGAGVAQSGPATVGAFGPPGAFCLPALEDPHYPARAHASLSLLGARLGAVRQEILFLQEANLSLLRVGGTGAARGGGGGGPRSHPLLMLPRGLGSPHRAGGGSGGRRRPGMSGGLATPRRSGLSVHTGGEDGRLGKRRRNEFDLGDVATPTLGAPKYVERTQVKTIDTPKVRQLAPSEVTKREEALAAYASNLQEGKPEAEAAELLLAACQEEGGGSSGGEEEDTSDEAFAARHKVLEAAERARYESFAATGQGRNKKPTKVTKERKLAAKPSRSMPHSSTFHTPTAALLGVAGGGGLATPAGAQVLPQSVAASAPWGPQHAAAAATPSALQLASTSLAAHVLQQAGAGGVGAGGMSHHLPLLVMPVHPAVTAAHMQAVVSAAATRQQQQQEQQAGAVAPAGEAAEAAVAEGEKERSPTLAREPSPTAGAATGAEGQQAAAARDSPAALGDEVQPPGAEAAAAAASTSLAAAAAAAAVAAAPPGTLPLALLHTHLSPTLQAILPPAQLTADAKRSRGRPRLRPRK